MATPHTRISWSPAKQGSVAVYLVEAANRKEVRQVADLFDSVGDLAEVVPIASGRLMSYAVQSPHDPGLLNKIEWALKNSFRFTVMERSFSGVIFDLVRGLCKDAQAQFVDLPVCDACAVPDPFPTRVVVHAGESDEGEQYAFCARCLARHAHEDEATHLRRLLRAAGLRISGSVLVSQVPAVRPDEMEGEDEVAALLAATG